MLSPQKGPTRARLPSSPPAKSGRLANGSTARIKNEQAEARPSFSLLFQIRPNPAADQRLDDTAVSTVRRLMVRHIEEPEPMPLFAEIAEVF